MKSNRRIFTGISILIIVFGMACSKRSRSVLTDTKQHEVATSMGCYLHPLRLSPTKLSTGIGFAELAHAFYLDMKDPESKQNLKVLNEAKKRGLAVCISAYPSTGSASRIGKVTLAPPLKKEK
jgi:hypothetical protein